VVGGNFSLSSANLILCTVGATNTASGFVCESGSDTASTKVDLSCSGGLQVDSTSTIVLYAWSGGSESIAPNAHSISPVLWGYWLGDNP
jgi:homoserine acetyltransferase